MYILHLSNSRRLMITRMAERMMFKEQVRAAVFTAKGPKKRGVEDGIESS
jgi:hypothetical protein